MGGELKKITRGVLAVKEVQNGVRTCLQQSKEVTQKKEKRDPANEGANTKKLCV